MPRVSLSLGSNVYPRQNLGAALAQLRECFGEITESPWYRARAVGFEGPDFINLAVEIDTELAATALDAWLHALEAQQGRDRTQPRFSDRTLDIDLVLYGDDVIDGPGNLRVPREELRHAFVLRPLSDIAPDRVPPDGDPRTLIQRWRELAPAERESVESIPALEAT